MAPRPGPDGTPIVPAVCANCGREVRIWGGPLYGRAEPDGRGGWRKPIARMWGGNYVHSGVPAMTQVDPPFVVRHARRVAAGEQISSEDQRAYEDALCQLTVLENLEQFVTNQHDTGRYEEPASGARAPMSDEPLRHIYRGPIRLGDRAACGHICQTLDPREECPKCPICAAVERAQTPASTDDAEGTLRVISRFREEEDL